jgi:anti-anti-sigma regulatory factor
VHDARHRRPRDVPPSTAADISARGDISAAHVGSKWTTRPEWTLRPPAQGFALLSEHMLRITVTTRVDGSTLVLEGRLGGAWVGDVAACWKGLLAEPDGRPIRIDLDGVTFINASGKALIRAMHAQGAILVATEVMIRTIVDEIMPGTAAAKEAGRTDARHQALARERAKRIVEKRGNT